MIICWHEIDRKLIFLFLFYFRGLEAPIGAKRILSHLHTWCYLLRRLQRKQVFRGEQVLQSKQWRKCSKKKRVLMMTEHKWSISEGIVMGFSRWSQDKGSWEHRTCEFGARGMSWLSWSDFCYLIHSGMTSIITNQGHVFMGMVLSPAPWFFELFSVFAYAVCSF